MTLLLFRQVSPVSDSGASADDATHSVASQHGMATLNDVVETNVTESKNEVNDPNAVVDEVEIETGDTLVHRLNVDNQTVEESALGEGWQEAYPKGRSGNGARKKFRQRQPYQRVSLNRNLNGRQDVHQHYIASPLQKTTPRPSLSKPSSLRALKNGEIDVSKKTIKPQIKSPGYAAATSTTLASKSLSYKEVALAPPGTVLKPMLEKLELNLERTETQIYRISSSSTGEESKSDAVMSDLPTEGTELPCEKEESEESVESVENLTSEPEEDLVSCREQKASDISRRKLSAAAEPYNPGGFLVTDPHSLAAEPISGTGIHSPPYYGANYPNGNGMPKTMNPDAPEFVPRRSVMKSSLHEGGDASVSVDSSSGLEAEKNAAALKKEELARQILLSFIVSSSQKEVVASKKKENKPKDDLADTSAKDSTVTEIVYRREEDSGVKENETDGGEGFVIVAKKRRKKRLTNDAAGIYHQPSSVCA